MSAHTQQELIAALRDRIAAVEKHPPLRDPAGPAAALADPLLRPLPGVLHEVFADERRNGAAALGFALGLARLLQGRARPALLFLQLAHAGQEAGLPYAPGLAGFGIDPGRLVIGRVETVADLLWAVEEALACKPVAAILADLGGAGRGPDFSASRRLSLRAAANGGTVLLLRHGRNREASAAKLRWHVEPAASGADPFDTLAPGQPRWRVRLEKGLPERTTDREWLLGWTENGFERVESQAAGSGGPARPAALPRPLPADLADRFPQTA